MSFADVSKMTDERRLFLVLLWVIVAVAAIGLDIALTVRLARKNGKSPWSRLAQLAAYAMGPAILVAAVLSVAFVLRGMWEPLPAIWMMLYGVAVWMASILSTRAPGMLGLVFIGCGVITLFWAAPVALAMVALTFGCAHVVYGIYLIARYGA